MTDRSYTLLFWGAISLTCHVLLVILLSKQPPEESSTLQVSIVAGTAIQSTQPVNSRASQALVEAVIPSAAETNADQTLQDLPTTTAPIPPPSRKIRDPASEDSRKKPETAKITETYVGKTEAGDDGENQSSQDEKAVARSLAMMPTTNSSYWEYLMQRLADPRWHDRQYDLSTLTRPRTLAMDLEFTSTGILRASRIALGSGVEQLDAAAIRASYAAAPYEAPPPEDRDQGFVYRIRIGYQPAAN